MKNLSFRYLAPSDYHKGYLPLLEYLTTVNKEDISAELFSIFVNNLDEKHSVIIAEDVDKKLIVGTGTLFIEPKLIHSAGFVGHIEDIVVHPDYRKKHVGKNIVQKLTEVAKEKHCYKVILDCSDQVKEFYQKCSFSPKELQMAMYLQ